jgi:hypothetical protein
MASTQDRSHSPQQAAQHEQGGGGKVDATSILYIVGGIPAIVAFVVILFTLTRSCGLPA